MRVVLASRSPRRKELLSKLYDSFEVITKETDETIPDATPIEEVTRILAVRKGEAVICEVGDDALVISSDTLVELDGVPLGKPKDEDDAKKMLLSLSGRRHNVHTGVAVHYKGRVYSGKDTSAVKFRELTDTEIMEYIACGEPMDKAGAYAIQGKGGKFVEEFDGEFDTIVGLSLKLTKKLIDEALKND